MRGAPLGRLAVMKRLLVPLTLGVGATRHLLWYLSYQVTGEARERERNRSVSSD